MTHHNPYWKDAERLNGWLAMLGIIAGIGAYATTGQLIHKYSSPYDWKMTCDDFIMSKYSVLQDPHLDAQAKYKIISYLEQKVVGECTKPLS